MLKIEDNNIFLTRGDSATIDLTIYDEDGNIYTPKQNDVIVFSVKVNVNNVELALRKTFDNLTLTITNAESLKFNYGSYFYDVKLINEDLTDTFITSGKFIIGGGTNE